MALSPSPFLLPMHFHPDRTLLKALIISVSAHAFLLLEVPRLLPVRPEAPSATITVSMQRAGNGTSQSPARHPEIKATEKPVIAKTPEQSNNHPRVLAVPDQSSSFAVASPPVASNVERDAVAESVVSPPARGSTSGSVGSAVPAGPQGPGPVFQSPGQEGVSAEEVRQYRTSLAISARRFKRYPALAKERGWEGSVEIAVDFRRVRAAPDVSVASSSGRPMLDEQALEMIRQAAHVTDLPERLRGRDFRVLLPITFSLHDER